MKNLTNQVTGYSHKPISNFSKLPKGAQTEIKVLIPSFETFFENVYRGKDIPKDSVNKEIFNRLKILKRSQNISRDKGNFPKYSGLAFDSEGSLAGGRCCILSNRINSREDY